MELKPDNRHLMGGMVGAVVLTAALVYMGMSAPGDVYYKPDHNVHPLGDYGVNECNECHAKPMAQVANESCTVCHPGGMRNKPKKLPGTPKPGAPAPPPDPFPQSKAAAEFHKLVKDQSCGACHIEHKHTALTEFLKLKPAQRQAAKGYPDNVHAFLPKEMQGEQFCATCHEPAELEGLKGDEKSLDGRQLDAPLNRIAELLMEKLEEAP